MRSRVWICCTVERPDPATPSTLVVRPGVFQAQARIRNIRPEQVLNYQSVFGTERTPTVAITIRDPPDAKIDVRHWVYRDEPPVQVWYRVRNVLPIGDVVRFLTLNCSIDKVNDARTDPVVQQLPPRWETPDVPIGPVMDRI